MKRPFRLAGAVAALGVVGTLLAGCGSSSGFGGIYDLPLPGGANLGSHPYQVTAQFTDVLDLVPQAAVKVNDVAVGRVQSISLPSNGWTANVTMLINGDVHLPANATAFLEQTSLLGEKYIELSPPTGAAAQGTLENGATIPLTRTNRNPEVEEVFGALSMLLNGGGIGQLQTIDKQLNDALSGNEPQIRAMLGNINALVTNLNDHRSDITQALDGINQLSVALAQRDQQIGNVLDNITPGLQILDQQRQQLVTMLNSLDNLSQIAVNTINASEQDMVADLHALAPTLQQLANAGSALPQALQVLVTYPFTDAVLDGIKGDYLNLYVSMVAQTMTQVPVYGKDGTTIVGFDNTLTPGAVVDGPMAPLTGSTSTTKAEQRQLPATTTTTDQPPLPLPSVSGSVAVLPSTTSAPPSSTSSPPASTTTTGSTESPTSSSQSGGGS